MKRSEYLKSVLFSALSFFLICCSNSDRSSGLEEAKKAISASNAIYFEAFEKNDSSIFIDCYAIDACIMSPGAPELCGKEKAGKFFRTAYNNYGLRGGRFITTAVHGDGREYVTEEGLWQSSNSKGELFDHGKFLVLWKRTPDGWKMYRDSFSADQDSVRASLNKLKY
jgi:ketosteroid isomerase-like protein